MYTKKNKNRSGFTLVELLLVISIIGILSGIILVNTGGSVNKSKQASAISTASSVLPELATCIDDGGVANAMNTANAICNATGHTTKWPDFTSSGYTTFGTGGTSSPVDETYYFTVSNGTTTIKCCIATSNCCVGATCC